MATPSADASAILVVNSGSSSLKFALFRLEGSDEAAIATGAADNVGRADGHLRIRDARGKVLAAQDHDMPTQAQALDVLARTLDQVGLGPPAAVGHRIVHGGPHLRTHQALTPAVLEQLRQAVHFAPLHIPVALELVERARARWPDARQFACIDTAFHQTMPPVATRLPLPARYAQAGVARYGFHGLSYESLVRRLGPDLPPRAVFAHLGNGASLCAVRDGKSVDTTMGMTPAGGIPMGTRSGDLDPGVILYLMRTGNVDADALEALINRESGLAGMADGESDMQALLARCAGGDAHAALAVEAFTTAVRKQIGAYAALMGGIDLLVFTGGIGEHSAEIRRRIVAGLDFLGLGPAVPGPGVMVVATEEEKQMARHCRALMRGTPP
ncbi:acetate/propionate family kinase [Bordetella bronchialis]|uniref:Acetate kinase n=2 Tax=Bordetella bronchialis TaxID=463025 RepID=A0A193FLX1_9BORD|nr:acetate/propionate family kinase [Bordetella bronchialis]ANN68171.1 acetate kinase [Bordetella bronchialis]ANN73304.1 acetate kinase [Bordetella bronchialis]